VVDEAQQEGKFCAENQTSSTHRGEKRAGYIRWLTGDRPMSQQSAKLKSEALLLVSHYYII